MIQNIFKLLHWLFALAIHTHKKYLAESQQFNILFLIHTLVEIRGMRKGLKMEKEENWRQLSKMKWRVGIAM